MSELESEESERRNQGEDLKILTPNQMLSRLAITLAQLKAGNNFFFVFFVQIKKLLKKKLYKNLVGII